MHDWKKPDENIKKSPKTTCMLQGRTYLDKLLLCSFILLLGIWKEPTQRVWENKEIAKCEAWKCRHIPVMFTYQLLRDRRSPVVSAVALQTCYISGLPQLMLRVQSVNLESNQISAKTPKTMGSTFSSASARNSVNFWIYFSSVVE